MRYITLLSGLTPAREMINADTVVVNLECNTSSCLYPKECLNRS